MGLLDRLFRRKETPEAPGAAAPRSHMPPVLPPPAPRPVPSPPRTVPPHDAARSDATVAPGARWIPPGAPISVHGFTIRGGMLYVGTHLRAPSGQTEPALIDPTLPVDNRLSRGPRPDQHPGPWTSYDELSPGTRAVYLAWLTGGRRDPTTPIGYAFLFLYGMERRVLVDILDGSGPESELPEIRAEVLDLLAVYGPLNYLFRQAGQGFVDLIDSILAHGADRPLSPPPLLPDRYEVPMLLRIELGRRAARGTPVPADLALAWAWYLPETSPRTPATRCAAEFARLWEIRFAAVYPDGMTLRPGKTRVELAYRGANPGLNTVAARQLDIPDVFAQKAPGRKLVALFEEVTTALDPYSRWLGRNPDGAGSLASFATLPPELATRSAPALDRLAVWASERLGKNFAVKAPGTEFLALWQSGTADRLAKSDAVALAQLLGNLGYGLEPDVRFGGATIASGTEVVLFASQPDAPHSPTPAYTAAATLVHLAAAVGIADGGVSTPEINSLGEHLKSSLGLSPPEMARLYAHFLWLSATDINLSGLRKRLGTMSREQRARIGEVMISVAAADGVVSPAEVTMLGKIFRLLGLDPARVASHLHATLTAGPPQGATRPVVVRPGGAPDPGVGIPPRPPSPATPPAGGAPRPFTLDRAAIDKKLAETAEVGILLSNLFEDDDEPRPSRPGAPGTGGQPHTPRVPVDTVLAPADAPIPGGKAVAPPRVDGGRGIDGPLPAPAQGTPRPEAAGRLQPAFPRDSARGFQPRAEPHAASAVPAPGGTTEQPTAADPLDPPAPAVEPATPPPIAGLDPAHSRFLRAVAERPAWTRAEFEDLAAAHHLMPDGAIDQLNEAAYDLAGEPVVDGDDDLTVNPYALEALLA